MNAQAQSLVVVGVDGSPGSMSAIHLATRAADRLGARLRLVHVTPNFGALAPAPMMVLPPSDLEDVGRSILERAAREARAEAPDLTVEIELRRGARPVELAEAASEAALLVVGRDSRPTLERLLLGNTAAGVACRARCPVVSVPAGAGDPHGARVVVVGVKSEAHAPRAARRCLRRGLGTPGAARRPARLEAAERVRRHHRLAYLRAGLEPALHPRAAAAHRRLAGTLPGRGGRDPGQARRRRHRPADTPPHTRTCWFWGAVPTACPPRCTSGTPPEACFARRRAPSASFRRGQPADAFPGLMLEHAGDIDR